MIARLNGVIDGRNGGPLPGPAEMYVHSNGNPLSLALYLAHGITTISRRPRCRA